MDIITEKIFRNYIENEKLSGLDDSKKFEYFINSLVAKSNQLPTIDAKDISTGYNAKGIDGIIVIINNDIIISSDEAKRVIDESKTVNVDFYLIQSKQSGTFDNKEMLNFYNWSEVLFDLKGDFSNETEEIQNFVDIIRIVYDNVDKFDNNPDLYMYYVTTGEYIENSDFKLLTERAKKNLLDLKMFRNVELYNYGCKDIQEMHRQIIRANQITIDTEGKDLTVAIDDENTVRSTAVSFKNFRNVFIDDKHNIKNVFEDNIRGYLGANETINKKIFDTLNGNKAKYFYMFNNGITIIAESVVLTGEKITLKNYQIVNGCQTCHVLYECDKDCRIDDIKIPIKIIETKNDDVKNSVTLSTNSQTSIGIEQLEAQSDFQKRLEEYYVAQCDKIGEKVYYERRTNQYREMNIPQYQIISIEIQMKAYYSMFIEHPEIVANSYGTLKSQIGTTLFNKKHTDIEYFVAGFAYYKLLSKYNNGKIQDDLWKFRYHILYALKYVLMQKKEPQKRDKHFIMYCEDLLKKIIDNDIYDESLNKSIEIVKRVYDMEKANNKRKIPEKATTTTSIYSLLKDQGYVLL